MCLRFFVPLLHSHVSFCFPSEYSRFRIFPMFWLYNIDFPIISFPNRKVDDKISFNQTEFWEANNNVAMKNSLLTFLNAPKGE